jgi:Circularly permutated YpsA SLOG family
MVVGQGMRSRLGQSARDTSRGFSCPEKIMSGGQAAADRAGLDFAIEAGLEHGGFVPRVAERKTAKSLSIINLPSCRVFRMQFGRSGTCEKPMTR